jgi:hypothetical protein
MAKAGATLEVADRFPPGTKVKAYKDASVASAASRNDSLEGAVAVAAQKVHDDGSLTFKGIEPGGYFASATVPQHDGTDRVVTVHFEAH